jgi:hypothetical protein
MGQEIVYCSRCSGRLLSADFENGKAFWIDAKPSCLDCVMSRLSELSPDEEARVLQALEQKRGPTPTPRTPMPAAPKPGKRKTSTAHIPHVKTERRASAPGRLAPVLAAVGAAGFILVLAAAFSVRPRLAPEPARAVREEPPPAPPAPAPPREPEVHREEAARKILEKALTADGPERIARLEEAVWECRGTAAFADARREHAKAQKERADQLAAALAPLDVLASEAVARERYADGLAALKNARGRMSGSDWTAALDQRALRLRHGAELAFAGLQDGALAARRRGAEADVKAAADRVAAWGWPDFPAALARALEAVPPPAPEVSPAARAAREAWERALARASERDYEAAARELRADPEEAALLKTAGDARADALHALAQWPKGQPLALEVEESPGVRTRLEGTVVKVSPWAVELRRESDVVTAAFDDLTPRAIRDLLAKPDPRALALLTALEEAVAEAALPPRFRAWTARAAEERARPETARKEAEASEIWRATEDARENPERAIESLAKLRGLTASHGETLFVRRRLAALAARLEEGKDVGREYVIQAERMRPGGGFAPGAHPKAASCWSVAADGVESALEFTFAPRPDAEYRCWVYVGACCAETFAFRWQADGQPEPLPAALSINFLKKTHAAHGGPKQPARFEWVALPLPKAASGPVRLRLLSAQQGFSVAWAVVSSTRTAPPGDTVLKEWERARPAAAPSRDAGLVAAWTFDEGRGTSAADASPNGLHGTLRNDPAWTSGRRRGALSFDGVDDYVELPKSSKMYFPGAFTVAAWVNLAELPSSKFGMYIAADYRETGDRSSLALRILPTGAVQFFWQHEDDLGCHASSSRGIVPGRWTHVAGVYDGVARRVYLDGLPAGENAMPQQRADMGAPLSIGRPGAYNGLYFRGRIDDVRLYARALSAAEIKALATAP